MAARNESTVEAKTMRFLIFVWITLAVAAAASAWYAMVPSRRGPARFWIGVCAVLLAAFAISFVMLGASTEKSLLSISFYFLNWGMAAGGAAICAGVIAGLSLALAFKR
ncbi:hypothetical protein [Nitrobacter sp. 62-13]|jgi:hypothetical protein|uniref:hypothetical protein n=1 Tax=Nitrobacter sp. 62-13 TaxID=1895797 RepID=UPI0026014C7C|nr:hypothetical protein [Nitrobacter sp. 62-13]